MRIAVLALIAACWTGGASPPRKAPVTEPAPHELHATVRIDAERGVSLELAGGKSYAIADEPHDVWRSFADEAVIATGSCYQAGGRLRFAIDHLRLAPGAQETLFVELGPEQVLRGTFVASTAPPGSKLAESPQTMFRSDAGTAYWIGYADDTRPVGTAAKLVARRVVLSQHVARPGGEFLWILAIHAPSHADVSPPPRVPCP